MKRIPNALLNKMTITDENYKEKNHLKYLEFLLTAHSKLKKMN